ncbi:MAG: sulfate/molybdate ABC transporter ATP-binding protein [bacterium]
MGIKIQEITKRFGRFLALDKVSVDVNTGELMALLGPSGSGKTTLLRIIAGLESPDEGNIFLYGEDAAAKNPRDRIVGFVFQHYALFRHMTVFENVAFGLKVRPRKSRPSKDEIRDRVFNLLKLVQLEHFSERYPSQLSGGQRQRVALARALAVEPKVLLLDEPFGALDAKVRKELRRWLRRLHDEIHVTSLFVTHDQEEALEVADRLVIMNEGKVEQIGTPEDVYHNPFNPFVFNFLGDVNFFHCRIENGHQQLMGKKIPDHLKSIDFANTTPVFIRPHLLDISLHPVGENFFRGKINHINPAGPQVKVELISEWGDLVQAIISQERYHDLKLKNGMNVYLIPMEMRTFENNQLISSK